VPEDLARLSLLVAPLFVIGAGAGVLRGLALRAPPGTRSGRTLGAAWVLLLLVATPLWLILAAVLRLW
jgi:hypothetical protein